MKPLTSFLLVALLLAGPYRTVQLNGRPHQGKLELKPGTWQVVARK
jgi:hypothetical protein